MTPSVRTWGRRNALRTRPSSTTGPREHARAVLPFVGEGLAAQRAGPGRTAPRRDHPVRDGARPSQLAGSRSWTWPSSARTRPGSSRPGATSCAITAVPDRSAASASRSGRAAGPRRWPRRAARGPAQPRLRRRSRLAAALSVRRSAPARRRDRRGAPHPSDGHGDGLPCGDYGGPRPRAAHLRDRAAGPPARGHPDHFGAGELGTLRAVVRRVVGGLAGRPDAGDDLVLAAHELAMNSVQHGGGTGTLLTWQDPDALVVEVRDTGRIDDPLIGRTMPDFGVALGPRDLDGEPAVQPGPGPSGGRRDPGPAAQLALAPTRMGRAPTAERPGHEIRAG